MKYHIFRNIFLVHILILNPEPLKIRAVLQVTHIFANTMNNLRFLECWTMKNSYKIHSDTNPIILTIIRLFFRDWLFVRKQDLHPVWNCSSLQQLTAFFEPIIFVFIRENLCLFHFIRMRIIAWLTISRFSLISLSVFLCLFTSTCYSYI